MASMLTRAILDYIDHLDDGTYFGQLLERAAPAEIARGVVDLTRSSDQTVVTHATLFAEDGCRRLRSVNFYERLIEAGFLGVLRDNLSRANYPIRRDAVVVIGRSFGEAQPDVAALFRRCLEHDPLLIDTVLMQFLGLVEEQGESRWSYVRRMAESPSYLTRWATIEVVTSNQ